MEPPVRCATSLDDGLEQAQEAAGGKEVSVCGADIAQQLLRAGQLHEIQVSVPPLLLSGGIRLFDHLRDEPIALEQTRVIPSEERHPRALPRPPRLTRLISGR